MLASSLSPAIYTYIYISYIIINYNKEAIVAEEKEKGIEVV